MTTNLPESSGEVRPGSCVVFDSGAADVLPDLDVASFGYRLIDARHERQALDDLCRRPWLYGAVVLWLGPGAWVVRDLALRALAGETTPNLRAVASTESLPSALRRVGQKEVLARLDEARPLAPPAVDGAEERSWQPYPVEMLPEPLRQLVRAAAFAIGVDPGFVAPLALAVAAGCIGTRRAISPKASWTEFPVLWAVVVADSGAGKTPALRELLLPLTEGEVAAIQAHRHALAEFEDDKRDRLEGSGRGGDSRTNRPIPPERILLSDATIEAVASRLEDSPLGLLLARHELGAWLASFNQYRGGRGGDAQQWCEMSDASAIMVDRRSARTISVAHAAVSVAGCATPAVVSQLLLGPHTEDGLLPRMLLVKPPRSPLHWTDRVIGSAARDEYARLLVGLRALKPESWEGGSVHPIVLPLSEAALARWRHWYDQAAERDRDAAGFEASVYSKTRAWALRIALVVHLCRCVHGDPTAEPHEVDDASLRAGLCLAEWHAAEGLRVWAELTHSGRKDHDGDLVAWIERHGGRATVRELQRSGPARFRPSAEEAEAALERLRSAGIGDWEDRPAPATGGVAPRAFVLFIRLPPATCDTRPDFPEPEQHASHVAPSSKPSRSAELPNRGALPTPYTTVAAGEVAHV